MNLLDVDSCPLHIAFESCRAIAGDHGVDLLGSELVGLVPLKVMLDAGAWFTDNPEQSDERSLVNSAIKGLGLEHLESFDAENRIIEWALKESE